MAKLDDTFNAYMFRVCGVYVNDDASKSPSLMHAQYQLADMVASDAAD